MTEEEGQGVGEGVGEGEGEGEREGEGGVNMGDYVHNESYRKRPKLPNPILFPTLCNFQT